MTEKKLRFALMFVIAAMALSAAAGCEREEKSGVGDKTINLAIDSAWADTLHVHF